MIDCFAALSSTVDIVFCDGQVNSLFQNVFSKRRGNEGKLRATDGSAKVFVSTLRESNG